MSISAMKQALKALDRVHSALPVRDIKVVGEAITALRAAIEEDQNWELKCQCYINIHDAVVKDNERLYALLEQCETEMRYAGWAALETDNFGRHGTYHAVLKYLHPEDFE